MSENFETLALNSVLDLCAGLQGGNIVLNRYVLKKFIYSYFFE